MALWMGFSVWLDYKPISLPDAHGRRGCEILSVLLKAKIFAACTNFVPRSTPNVIPAPAGIQFWTPAFAGVTSGLWLRLCCAARLRLISVMIHYWALLAAHE